MGDASEVVREVGVDDFRVATEQERFHLDHRLLGVAPGAIGTLLWWKVGFEDRFQHQHRCCHGRRALKLGWRGSRVHIRR